MVHSRRFSAKDRERFAKVAHDVVALEERAKKILFPKNGRLGLGGSLSAHEFERCPACGHNLFEVEFSHGSRTCRSCGHYERENGSAEENAEVLARSRARWAANHKGALA